MAQQEAQLAPRDATAAFVADHFAAALLETVNYRDETTLVLEPGALVEICAALRDTPALRYDYLADVTAVDWPDRIPRFDVVYHLLSLETRARVRLKVRVGQAEEDAPAVPSVQGVWPTANWYEREIFDLFGLIFTGHPDLRRLVMPADWEGHPLRKDYPLTGFALPDPHWGGQVPYDQPLQPGIGRQTLRVPTAAPPPEPPRPEPRGRKRPRS